MSASDDQDPVSPSARKEVRDGQPAPARGDAPTLGSGEKRAAVEAMRDTLLSLCRVPSPSRDERAVADLLRARLGPLGATVREDDAAHRTGGNAGNLIAELSGGLPQRIGLAAHMDTVPLVADVPIDPVVEGNVVRAGGRQILGADDKAGVSVILSLLERAVAVPFETRPTLVAVFTVCEELGLQGAHHLDVAALAVDHAYSFDGEVPVGELITSAVSKEALTLTITGRAAHAALEPENGVHAIVAAAEVIRAIPMGRVSDDQVCNVGSIRGGGATNVVPAAVVMEGEARAFSAPRLEELIGAIETHGRAAASRYGATLELERRHLYDGYAVADDAAPIVQLESVAARHGITPVTVRSIGGSDTNVLNQKGMPTVNVGLGMHEIHSVHEWIDVQGLVTVVDWLEDALWGRVA